jgi:hypothetical protein
MSKSSNAFVSLLHRVGVAGPARVRAIPGSGVPKISQRFVLATLAVAASCAALLALGAGAAQAGLTHKFLKQITGFNRVVGIAVGPVGPLVSASEKSALFVADHNASDVVRVSSAGTALPFECVTAGKCAGGYVEGDVLKGTPAGGFQAVGGVALGDKTGEIYVSAGNAVDVYASSGEFLGAITEVPASSGAEVTGAFRETAGLAFDQASGELYVADERESSDTVDVFKMTAGGGSEFIEELGSGAEKGVLSDHGGGHQSVGVSETALLTGTVYVTSRVGATESYVVDVFSSLGALEASWTGGGTLTGSFGIQPISAGVDPVTGHEFVVDGQHEVVNELPASDMAEETALGRLTGTPSGGFGRPSAVQVDPETDNLYVGDEGVVDAFGPGVVVPDVTTGVASQVTPASATLSGTVNPLGEGAATCRFALGTTSELGQPPVACSAGVSEGGAPVDVRSEALEGLQPDTTYYYRLEATNRNGTNAGEGVHAECEGKPSEDGCFLTLGPGIEGESVSDVASTSATLDAEIDPNDAPTSYYFEYGPTTAYGSDAPLASGEAIGSQKGLEPVSQHVHGLSLGSVYHYRVVAVSELSIEVAPGSFETKVETFAGADESFTTQSVSAFALPDSREWELVSPPDKHGALIEPINQEALSQAAVGGDAITYETNAPTELEPLGDTNNTQVLSVRGPSGWVSRDLTIPHESVTGVGVGEGQEYRAFSEDLSLGALEPFGTFVPSLSPEASESTAFLQTDFVGGDVDDLCTESCYRPLVTGCPPVGQPCLSSVSENADVPAGTVFGLHLAGSNSVAYGPFFEGGSPDFSHIVLSSASPGGGGSAVALDSVGGSLYEWSGGELSPISVLPDGVGVNGKLGSRNGDVARNAISDDGSRVFWSDESTNVLYMRYNATQPQSPISLSGECTVRTDACTIQIGAGFQDASSDGSRVFFGEAGGGGLYECEIVEEAGGGLGCKLSSLGGPGVVLGASEDGSWVYFVSGDDLDVRHAGVTKLIAVLSSEESQHYQAGAESALGQLTARVSPDGHWLAFMSQRELVPGDVTRDALSGEPDEEVYLYSGETEKLVCASCDPTGARPVGEEYPTGATGYDRLFSGDEVWGPSTWLAANIPGWTKDETSRALHQSRYLSDSGRLFFNSRDPLVPQAVNGTWDVYEYEPPGVGSCSASNSTFSAHTDGCVGLISSGTSESESAFLDASESGGDVFFLTKSRLAPQDYDNAIDVYDAHECTTLAPCFPATALAPPPCTTGDACKPAPTPQPTIYGAPSSETFSGAGNVVPQGSSAGVTSKALTRAQKLAGALKACRKKPGRERAACKKRARRAYGPLAKAKGSRKKGGR